MILKTEEVTPAYTLTVSLPIGSIPIAFINQGLKGVFLWYLDSAFSTKADFIFHFVSKGGQVNPLWQPFGTFKDANYKQVFWEK